MSRDALIVGVNTYQRLPGLQAPAHDAEAIAHQLHTYGDFRVTRLPEVLTEGVSGVASQTRVGLKTPVTLRDLESALVRLFKPKGSNIPYTAVFYFSGHGLQKDAGIQEGYLATSDADPERGNYGLSLFWLRRLLQESPVRQRILWLDCCHSGELLNFLEADPGAHAGTDRLFMAASREYEPAYESLSGPYSIFTQALLKGLDPWSVTSGMVTNYSLTNAVSRALKGEMQQPLFENSGSEILLTRHIAKAEKAQSEPKPTSEQAKTTLQKPVLQKTVGKGASVLPPTLMQSETLPIDPPLPSTPIASLTCPYRGLEFFDTEHAEYFFGREDLTDQLLETLRLERFVAIVGASGSGKSSLVRAGLIHALKRGQKFSGSDRWQVRLITPTERPFHSLATAFIDPQATGLERVEQIRRAEDCLKAGDSGLAELAASVVTSSTQKQGQEMGDRARLVLVIDQFEEIFTLCQGVNAESDRRHFFQCLIQSLQVPGNCLSLVIVLRADFFGKCSLYTGLAQQIERHLVTATPLTPEQIKAIIQQPAQKVGLVCDPNLIYTILLEIVGAPGELALLQYTLLELWHRRQLDPTTGDIHLTLDAYRLLGGVRGTLQKQATETFYSLTPEEQRVARQIFLSLTQLGQGTEDTRRRVLKSELVSPCFAPPLVERVLEKLVAAKLVITNHRSQVRMGACYEGAGVDRFASPLHSDLNSAYGPLLDSGEFVHISSLGSPRSSLNAETVEVAHETLIRNWPLLRTWLDEDRERLRRQRQIERSAREWDSAGRPIAVDYLLRGSRLIDVEDYLRTYPGELSALAQHYVSLSQEESRKARKESRLLQIAIPSVLLLALTVSFNQYHVTVQNQAEKDYQLRLATSRQWAAIAQSLLHEPDSDPVTALLISRLAIEKGGRTTEAQASLRAALQKFQPQGGELPTLAAVDPIQWVAFLKGSTSNKTTQLVTIASTGKLQHWNLKGEQIHKTETLPLLSATPTSAAFSPDGQVAIANTTGAIELIQIAPSQLPRPPRTLKNFRLDNSGNVSSIPAIVRQLVFSPDGQQLLGVSDDRTARLWNLKSGQQVRIFQGHTATVTQAQFSPDGQRVVTASWDGTAQIWDTASGQHLATLHHQDVVSTAFFSPDSKLIVTASWDRTARVWDVVTGTLRVILAGHRSAVMDARFSPNGQMLVTASDDGTARLWNAQTGYEEAQLRDTRVGNGLERFHQAFFSPDSQYVATLTKTGKVRLWAATWDSLTRLAHQRTSRQLTLEECLQHLRLPPNACPTLPLNAASVTPNTILNN